MADENCTHCPLHCGENADIPVINLCSQSSASLQSLAIIWDKNSEVRGIQESANMPMRYYISDDDMDEESVIPIMSKFLPMNELSCSAQDKKHQDECLANALALDLDKHHEHMDNQKPELVDKLRENMDANNASNEDQYANENDNDVKNDHESIKTLDNPRENHGNDVNRHDNSPDIDTEGAAGFESIMDMSDDDDDESLINDQVSAFVRWQREKGQTQIDKVVQAWREPVNDKHLWLGRLLDSLASLECSIIDVTLLLMNNEFVSIVMDIINQKVWLNNHHLDIEGRRSIKLHATGIYDQAKIVLEHMSKVLGIRCERDFNNIWSKMREAFMVYTKNYRNNEFSEVHDDQFLEFWAYYVNKVQQND